MTEQERIKELGRQKYLERRRKYYANNKDKYKDWNYKWREKNLERDAESKKRYKIENSEKIKATTKKYNNRTARERYEKHIKKIGVDEFNRRNRERRSNRSEDQKNKDKQYAKKYRIENSEKIKQYHSNRKDKRREQKRKYFHKKYRSDAEYKLLHNLRSRIKNVIKLKAKDLTTLKLLGCTIIDFRKHIESLFKDVMNWDGVFSGEIHIDHIKPCSKFDLSNKEEQIKCFHYTNLQPLWWRDNLIKGSKY